MLAPRTADPVLVSQRRSAEAGLHERLDSAPSCARRDKRASNQRREHTYERALIHSVVSFLKFNVEARLKVSLQTPGWLHCVPEPGTATKPTSTLQNDTGEQQPNAR
eukprot:scaffold103924_cov69-Phaeocystis_antarctica.AAC.2